MCWQYFLEDIFDFIVCRWNIFLFSRGVVIFFKVNNDKFPHDFVCKFVFGYFLLINLFLNVFAELRSFASNIL